MASNNPATEALWKAMGPTFERILEHPFITGLADGSLPKDKFAGYLIQDQFYLEEYGRCWALLGAQSPVIDDLVAFTGKIAGSLAHERNIQDELLESLGYCRDQMLAKTEPSPTCVGFTSFIKNACATRAWHDGFVSVLECPWAYWELGKVLNGRGSPDPHYQKWIEGYLTEGFEEACEQLHAVWERVALDLGPLALQSAAHHARTAIRYDWMFWDAAYRAEQWPA